MSQFEQQVQGDRQGVPFMLLIPSQAEAARSTAGSLQPKVDELQAYLDKRPSLREPGTMQCFTTHGGPTIITTPKDTVVHDANNTYHQVDEETDQVDQEPDQED